MSTQCIITDWSTSLGAGRFPVLPDGCRDLILCCSETAPPQILLTGLDSTPRIVSNISSTHYVGLRLSPGTRFAWEEDDNYHNDNQLTEQHSQLGSWVTEILRRPQHANELLHNAVEQWGMRADTLVEDFLSSLKASNGNKAETNLSERQLRRRIKRGSGQSPIFWQQLYRSRKAAVNLTSNNKPFAVVAAEQGYADQAHMNREIKRWFGLSPGVLRSKAETYGHYFTSPDAFSR